MDPNIIQVELIENLPSVYQILIQMLIVLIPNSIVGLGLYIGLSKLRTKEGLKLEKQKFEFKEKVRVSKEITELVNAIRGEIYDYVSSSMLDDEINDRFDESITEKCYRIEKLLQSQRGRITMLLRKAWDRWKGSFATNVSAVLMLQKEGVLVEKSDLSRRLMNYFGSSNEFLWILYRWAFKT